MTNTQLANLIKMGLYFYGRFQEHNLFIEDVDKILDNIDLNSYISFTELMKKK